MICMFYINIVSRWLSSKVARDFMGTASSCWAIISFACYSVILGQ